MTRAPGPHARRRVAQVLWNGERMSRAQLARRLRTSKTTVTKIVDELLQHALVVECPKTQAGRGRASTPLRLNAEHGVITGVDLGASRTRMSIANLDGTTLSRREASTPSGLTGDELARYVVTVQREMVDEVMPAGRVVATVIGVPGVVRGLEVRHAPNLPGVEGAAFVAEVRRLAQGPVRFQNDVNLAAYAEAVRHPSSSETVALLSIGTGLGVGIVRRGEVWEGAKGRAGEIGFMPFASPVGHLLEHVLSGRGLERLFRHFGGEGGSREALASRTESAQRTQETFKAALAVAIVALSTVLDPHQIVIGGGVGRALCGHVDAWLDEIRAHYDVVAPVAVSTLEGDEEERGAVALARVLAFEQLFSAATLRSNAVLSPLDQSA